MSKLSIRAIALVLCGGLISCTIENSSSAKLSGSKKPKNGDLIIDKAMSDREGYERLGEMLILLVTDCQAQPILKNSLNGSLMK